MNDQVNYAKIQRIQDNLEALTIGTFGTGFVTDAMLYESGIKDTVAQHTSDLAENTNIKGTTQTPTYNADGTIQKIQHIDSNSQVLREDVFTYTDNLITEIRTLTGGDNVTFKYHLDTLSVEVI